MWRPDLELIRDRWGLILLILLLLLCGFVDPAAADHISSSDGDLFVSGRGALTHFTPDGILLESIPFVELFEGVELPVAIAGTCMDVSANLYGSNWGLFEPSSVFKLNSRGDVLTENWVTGFSDEPESCVIDAAGNIYTGEVPTFPAPDDNARIFKFSPDGTLLATFNPVVEARGVDWIDLAADQCTMYYTSEGSSIKRFDVCTNTQLADFATGLAAPCYSLQIRSNGEVIVACRSQVYRLDPSGATIRTYSRNDVSEFFALTLDPDGTSFWTADINGGDIFRINIATGALITSFDSMVQGQLGGLLVVQSGLIFSDGFESGNISVWTSSAHHDLGAPDRNQDRQKGLAPNLEDWLKWLEAFPSLNTPP